MDAWIVKASTRFVMDDAAFGDFTESSKLHCHIAHADGTFW